MKERRLKVTVDGVEMFRAAAIKKFSAASGVKAKTLAARFDLKPECTSEWLTRAPLIGVHADQMPRMVSVDGVSMRLSAAAIQYAASSGIKCRTLVGRLVKRPDCASDWLTRVAIPRAKYSTANNPEKPSRAKPVDDGKLSVNGSRLTPERTAHLISRLSHRQPVAVARCGTRVVIEGAAKHEPSRHDIGVFDRAPASLILENLAA